MTEVPVSYVVTMLRRKTATDPEIRFKYALLALLSAVIVPTSHNPRIAHQHAEKIKDVDQFLAFPWGRASFDMLMSSIKERDEVSLSQNTIALKGFVLSLQLVMIEAVPSLTGVVEDGGSSASDGDESDDEDGNGKKSINTGHVSDTDTVAKVYISSLYRLQCSQFASKLMMVFLRRLTLFLLSLRELKNFISTPNSDLPMTMKMCL